MKTNWGLWSVRVHKYFDTVKYFVSRERICTEKILPDYKREEIRFLLEESDMLEVDILEILRQVSDMSALQGRLRDLCRDRTELLSWEEEVTG